MAARVTDHLQHRTAKHAQFGIALASSGRRGIRPYLVIDSTAKARNLVQESEGAPYDLKAGEIFKSGVLAETVQSLVVDNMAPRQAAAQGAAKIARLMKA